MLKEEGYDDARSNAALAAVAGRDFSGVEALGRKDTISALGLALTAERARAMMASESLERLDTKALSRFGMTEEQRNVIVMLQKALVPTNPEFLRFKARAMEGEDYPERPKDALRESRRTTRALERVRAYLEEKGAENIFGPNGKEFAAYLSTLEGSMRPLSEKGEPYAAGWRTRHAKTAWEAFEHFVGDHPDFPLILLPRSEGGYVQTEAENLGAEPEMRVLWQSPEQRQRGEALRTVSSTFAGLLHEYFPEHVDEDDAEHIAGIRPIVADDLSSFGVNMTFRAEAQEFEKARAFLLIENRVRSELVEPVRENLWKAFGGAFDDIIQTPEFEEYLSIWPMQHELGHNVYGEESASVKRLGREAYDAADEHRADLLAGGILRDTLIDRAREQFGDRAELAVNLTIVGNAITCARETPGGDLNAYYHSAVAMLNRIAENGIISTEDGESRIDQTKLRENLSETIFLPQAREVLSMYGRASRGTDKEARDARAEALRIGETEPEVAVAKLREQLNRG